MVTFGIKITSFYWDVYQLHNHIYLMARGFGISFVSKVRMEYRCCTVLVQTLCSSWSLDFSSLEHLSPKLTSKWPRKTKKSQNIGTQDLAIFNWISLDVLLYWFWKDGQRVRFSKVALITDYFTWTKQVFIYLVMLL